MPQQRVWYTDHQHLTQRKAFLEGFPALTGAELLEPFPHRSRNNVLHTLATTAMGRAVAALFLKHFESGVSEAGSYALQAKTELKRLSNRTVSVAGGASQASLNRHLAVDLLELATGAATWSPQSSNAHDGLGICPC